jgi:hypothetical protein
MLAAAGIVVTEMNTPISALARASVSDTTPTIAASIATTTENRSGLLIRSATGRTPRENAAGVWPDQRISAPKARVRTIAARNPAASADRPRMTGSASPRSMPSATPMIALYSGPTIIAPTMRMSELTRIPTAPISPAMASRMKKLGGYTAPARIRASTTSQTGATSRCTSVRFTRGSGRSPTTASMTSIATGPARSSRSSRRRSRTALAADDRRSHCTASPAGRRPAPGRTVRFVTPGSAARRATMLPVRSPEATIRR